MSNIRVGVLRGGPSKEHHVSLKTGASILSEFSKLTETHSAEDVFIDKQGNWHVSGITTTPLRASRRFDVFFNALHGAYGEDGKIQRILDAFGAPYTGSGVFSSAIGMHKHHAKEYFSRAGLKVPMGKQVRRSVHAPDSHPLPDVEYAFEKALEIFHTIGGPWIIKPSSSGSSVGIRTAETLPDLAACIYEGLKEDSDLTIEERVYGREATCAVVENMFGEKTYSLAPVEIIPVKRGGFFDYESKYNGTTAEICPGNFTTEETENIRYAAQRAHEVLGLTHYSRTDCIVGEDGIYVLETNSLPGLTSESLLPKALNAHNIPFSQFLSHIVDLALHTKR